VPPPAATPQPSPLLAKLAKPTPAYKRRAWLAVGALALFVVLYFGLAAWFLHTAYRLTFGSHAGSGQAFWGWLVGACAAFLAVFMLKAVFFVKRGGSDDHMEITQEQQPELFRFLYRVADKAGAPRPHKVVVSPRVNAAVFYDLSVVNLLFPSRKNLEIGLGLVNSLSLGEFHAVLAHEFGHFAQRAMAVGRWVYVAQQIAGHLVARRDKLDDFLGTLSRLDPRIGWVGWILRLIVWSIRSLVDSVFHLVVLVQRALSREMEMNADLVAVSLTGSDALVHALHRLPAADDAWGRAVGFVLREKARGKITRDLFAVQAQVVSHMGQLLNDPGYGLPPRANAAQPQEHRVFKAELAQPPQMWLTHPLNHEREANAKRHYVHAPIDARPAWSLFADAQALRERVTAKLLDTTEPPTETVESSLQALTQQFEREHLNSRYRGIYFGRSIVRCANGVPALYETVAAPSAQDLDALYPPSLEADMERLRTLEKELAQLQALHSGTMRPPNGVIQHRETQLKRAQLPQAITQVAHELAQVQARLQAHDRRCRSLHRAAAAALGLGWPDYLQGLLAALHYADHVEANLLDLQGMLRNCVQVATATRKVNAKGLENILGEANRLRAALGTVYSHAAELVLDTTLQQRLGHKTWGEALGTLELPDARKDNIAEWLQAVDSWVEHAAGTCGALRNHALEQLLLSESAVAGHTRAGSAPESAPAPTTVPLSSTGCRRARSASARPGCTGGTGSRWPTAPCRPLPGWPPRAASWRWCWGWAAPWAGPRWWSTTGWPARCAWTSARPGTGRWRRSAPPRCRSMPTSA
jgi:Zn-dependent protease with chaperone function